MPRDTGERSERILIIKLGALGDFVQALGPFLAIRRAHPLARVTLLTTRPFVEFARASGYFDEIWVDPRPKIWDIPAWIALRRRILDGRFNRVYDLQTNDRTSTYFRMLWPNKRPQWSGIAPGCSHPHDNPNRDFMHTVDRQTEQLWMAGVRDVPSADLSWAAADVSRFRLPPRYVLLVPGGSPHRPAKRWPADRFAVLSAGLVGRAILPVLVGTAAEAEVFATIQELCPEVRSLAGETSFFDLAALARGAAGAVGNDTGPMHLIAAAGCPSVVLFSSESHPELCAPRGRAVTILKRDSLADLPVVEVAAALDRNMVASPS